MSSPTLDEAAIFNAARQIEAADARRRYIEGVCEGDPALQARLEALLLIDEADRGFLERPAQGVAPAAPKSPKAQGADRALHARRTIGEGGFGKVFVAEQQNQCTARSRSRSSSRAWTPARSSPGSNRSAGAGADGPPQYRPCDRRWRDRIGPALLRHGAGPGVPITDFCDAEPLTPRERLKLFVSVCQRHPARASQGHHPSRHQAVQRDGDAVRR